MNKKDTTLIDNNELVDDEEKEEVITLNWSLGSCDHICSINSDLEIAYLLYLR